MADIHIEVDIGDTDRALDDLARLVSDATSSAAHDSAQEIQGETRTLLHLREHPPFTKTPSPPGSPPASISGRLADSVHIEDEHWAAQVGPDTVYARIQERGGEMHGHPTMHWFEDGAWYHSRAHSLPARSYFRPAVDTVIADGSLERIWEDHILRAIEEAAS